jgi:hypothetical protein
LAPTPLTPVARRLATGALILGIVVVLFEVFRIITVKESDLGILDAAIGGGGGGMLAMGALMLFHRPDR